MESGDYYQGSEKGDKIKRITTDRIPVPGKSRKLLFPSANNQTSTMPAESLSSTVTPNFN